MYIIVNMLAFNKSITLSGEPAFSNLKNEVFRGLIYYIASNLVFYF